MIDLLASGLGAVGHQLGGLFLSPWSPFALPALAVTLGIAAMMAVPRGHRRPVPVAVLARALFPRRLWRTRSGRADIGWFIGGLALSGAAIGWALMSSVQVSTWIAAGLASGFGPVAASPLPKWVGWGVMMVAVFVAYEFAYWLDHYLSHKLPVLWQFHQVHHSAEHLSLLTNARVHPVDTIIFYNLVAVITGVTVALVERLVGVTGAGGPTNALILLAAVVLTHLQHSHLWVGFGPRWGRVLLGPAHHQVHHSTNPDHYDRNFGNALAVFDRLFGTFHHPSATREVTQFGTPDVRHDPHGVTGGLLMPFVGAGDVVGAGIARRLRAFGRRSAGRG